MSEAHPEQSIGDSKFEVKKDGLDAVILFPALGSPALVDASKKLTVIVAVHEGSMKKLEKLEKKSFTMPGEKVGEKGALKMHSHIFLMDWQRNHPLANNEQSYLAHFQSITANQFLIYQSHSRAKEAFGTDYRVCYLGRLTKENVQPLYVFTGVEDGNTPFGVLDESAIKLYKDHEYTYLFQLEFRNFESADLGTGRDKELLELVWVWGDMAGAFGSRSETYEKPADTVLITNWEKNLGTRGNGGGGWFWGGEPLLAKDTTFKREYRTRNTVWADSNVELPMYPLLNPGSRKESKAYEKSHLPAASQKNTHFLMARHPVFVCTKEQPDIGIIGDMHMTSRHALYTQTNCQVIPGADYADSPNLGLTFNEFLSSSRKVLDEVCAQSDILVIVGDIIDHDKNLHPGRCANEVGRTGQLWEIVDFGSHKDYYPRFIDSVILQELLLLCMDKGTPVFFITGNHEGYQDPYGISPRAGFSPDLPLVGSLNGKVNEGIPMDHNLSIYEAVLLYGKHYHKCRQFPGFLNFDEDVINCYYQWFSPWHDVIVPHGKQNFIFLGWGKDEGYIKSTLEGGKSLPRAYTPMTDAQLSLLVFAASEAQTKKNVLFSHFTYISYTPLLALKDGDGNPCEANITIDLSRIYKAGVAAGAASTVFKLAPKFKYGLKAGAFLLKKAGERESAFCVTNTGSFTEKLQETWSLLTRNAIHYTVSGHAHRSCVYEVLNSSSETTWASKALQLTGDGLTIAWNKLWKEENQPFQGRTDITVAPVAHADDLLPRQFDLAEGRANCIVTGSAGPMSVQNVEGEFGGLGMDMPQGMVFSLANNSVQVIRQKNSPPRLAAVAGGIRAIAGELPFGSNFDMAKPLAENVVKVHWDYQIQTTWGGQYYAEINETWEEAFGNFPFSHMKLYCVDNLADAPLAQFFQLTISHREDKKVYFKETSKQVQAFLDNRLKKFSKAKKLSDGSFLSLHFGGDRRNSNSHAKYIANYDQQHPFIVYVDLTETWVLGHAEISMRPCEIPPFSFYEKFEEFQ